MIDKTELGELIDQMKLHGVEFDLGLSDEEIYEIEQSCKFQFPVDLRTFLQLGMPIKWTRPFDKYQLSVPVKWTRPQYPLEILPVMARYQWGVPVKWRENKYISEDFPNWRKDPVSIMREARKATTGIFYFDIEYNRFWLTEWGAPPQTLKEAFAIADKMLQTAPLLIPIYGQCFLPAQPNLPGNPVFSIWQAVDTIYYGYNLQGFLRNMFISVEFDRGNPEDYRYIPLWSNIVRT